MFFFVTALIKLYINQTFIDFVLCANQLLSYLHKVKYLLVLLCGNYRCHVKCLSAAPGYTRRRDSLKLSSPAPVTP